MVEDELFEYYIDGLFCWFIHLISFFLSIIKSTDLAEKFVFFSKKE